jgi:hypothetical protein
MISTTFVKENSEFNSLTTVLAKTPSIINRADGILLLQA